MGGAVECVKLLLSAGAAVNQAAKEGDAPLHCAASKGDADCVKQLLSANAAINQAGFQGGTALGVAVLHGQANCVKQLLGAGAAVDKATERGSTPLHFAAQEGQVECVKLLLGAGGTVDQADNEGGTPLHWAAKLGQVECVKLLLVAGAAVDQADNEGSTPVLLAAEFGQADSIKLLLAAGATVDPISKKRWTPLHIAAQEGQVECVKLLLAAGATVDPIQENGWTPLHFAAHKGEVECVKLLLEAGANVNRVDGEGCTPLQDAINHGYLLTVQVISSHGASRSSILWHTVGWLNAEEAAAHFRKAEILAWLQLSREWTPLQHLEVLTVQRTRALLRAGADLHAGEPSALERARFAERGAMKVGSTVRLHSLMSRPLLNGKMGVVVADAGASTGRVGVRVPDEHKPLALKPANLHSVAAEGEAMEASRLIEKAAVWSPESHELFPRAARKWAVEVMRIGCLIARDKERLNGEAAASGLEDCWRSLVLPNVVARPH